MSSFYHSITSDGSRDTHPSNHGGNFTIELYDELHFPKQWEVGLVEMTYTGQIFPNIPHQFGEVSISSHRKGAYQTDFVLNYHQIDELEIRVFIRHNKSWMYNKMVKLSKKDIIAGLILKRK